jgi:hypothetical protein
MEDAQDAQDARVDQQPGTAQAYAASSPLDQRTRRRAQWTILAIVIALVAGAAVHRLTVVGRIDQTAALFIGVPAVIALAVAAMRPSQSATGLTFRVITIGLALAGILLGEGLICLVMAAPLFYLVGFAIGGPIDHMRARRARRESSRAYSAILPLVPVIALALEGNVYSFPRQEIVIAERTVAASPAQVESALAEAPHFEGELPLSLRIGFPRPVASRGQGLQVGDQRVISFLGQKKGLRPKDLTLEVVAREQVGEVQRVRFRAISDQTKIGQWLHWDGADVEWLPVPREGGARATQVRWTLRYSRRLDPAWYFSPFERYATSLAADYLVQAAATPR